tara:strand:- start:3583 stop:4395 length:813 start_codon:yes stop_codon:yes gene_type:complete
MYQQNKLTVFLRKKGMWSSRGFWKPGETRLIYQVIDTVILLLIVINNRIKTNGLFKLFTLKRSRQGKNIVWIDAGLHEQGAELEFVINNVFSGYKNIKYFGFECCSKFCLPLIERYKDHTNVNIHNIALNNTENESIIYHDTKRGLGNGLYKRKGTVSEIETVPSTRLSTYITKYSIDMSNSVVFLRMNIEGAECVVIHDLHKYGLLEKINGFYGLWDDVRMLPRNKRNYFNKLLQRYNIQNLTFNGRDFRVLPFIRLWCIKYHIYTQLL